MSLPAPRAVAALLVAALCSSAGSAQSITIDTLLDEMTDRGALCEFPNPPYVSAQTSSRDPASSSREDRDTWFSEADAGHFASYLEHQNRREGVLLSTDGPGAVVRIWSANPKGVLRVYLDGAEVPVIAEPMGPLLSGKGSVPSPLAAAQPGGAALDLPIPYEKSCLVTCDEPDGLIYHVGYRTWFAGTLVSTLAAGELAAKADLLQRTGSALVALPEPLENEVTHPFRHRLSRAGKDGATVYTGFSNLGADPQCICELRIQVVDSDPEDAADLEQLLRQTLLIIVFDKTETVRMPLGDFFGSAPGLNPFESFPMIVEENGMMVCRYRMPYQSTLFVRIEALAAEPVDVFGYLTLAPYEWTPNTMYFHADWKSQLLPTQPVRDWTSVSIRRGRGILVGDALSVGNPVKGWWGNGDERIYVDDEDPPSLAGTGTGDYFGVPAGPSERFAAPFGGQSRVGGPGSFGYTALHRFRALDAVPFFAELRLEREIAHTVPGTRVSYAATTWYYADLTATVEGPAPGTEVVLEVPPLVYKGSVPEEEE